MIWYFAYGSNMSLNRMNERGIKINEYTSAKLENYELRFNKISKKQGAVANIVPKQGSIVEGVLYNVDNIEQLDKYEGFPEHYKRTIVFINGLNVWVYIAQEKYIKEGLKPSKEYLGYLLEGKEFLSKEYFEKLEQINETI